MTKGKKVALYLRVSTDKQTTANQRRELTAWAERCGHEVVTVFEDACISGSKGRDKRPGSDAMLKAAVRREFDILAVWSTDRVQPLAATLDRDSANAARGSARSLYRHAGA